MKPLLLAALVLVPAPQDAWWDPAWSHRRRLAVVNGPDRALPAGAPIEIEIDPAFLELAGRAKADLSDLAVVHGGRRLPHVLLPGRAPDRRRLAFAAAEGVAAGATDGRYAVYYGNPAGVPPGGKVFDLFEDFADEARFRGRFEVDGGLGCAVREGALEIRGIPEERTRLAPARLVWKARPASASFAAEFDLEADLDEGPLPAAGVEIELRGAAKPDEAVARKIAALAEALGEDGFERREQATRALIAIGPAAVPALLEAARSSDPEVRWRSEQAVREIRKASPPELIRAGIDAADGEGRFALLSEIGGAATRQITGLGTKRAFSLKVLIERREDGSVSVSWNGGRGQQGSVAGQPERISFVFHRTSAGRPAKVRIDHVILRSPAPDGDAAATVLEAEETRP
jgi:hypothetical protein